MEIATALVFNLLIDSFILRRVLEVAEGLLVILAGCFITKGCLFSAELLLPIRFCNSFDWYDIEG